MAGKSWPPSYEPPCQGKGAPITTASNTVCNVMLLVFVLQLPPGSPSSVTLQPAPGDTGKVL